MSDLTGADLEAMGERVSHARKVLYSPPDVIIPTLYHDVDALIAALREARGELVSNAQVWANEVRDAQDTVDKLLAENRLLVACLNSIRCLAVEGIGAEREELARKVASIYATCIGPELVPLTAAEVERVRRMEAESRAARAYRDEYRKDFGARKDLGDNLHNLFQLLDEHDEAAALGEGES